MDLVLLYALAVVSGLSIGSFLNVVIARVPQGESVLSPRSRCPRCEYEITLRDNIPVLSWILLRGKCRSCSLAISPIYWIVEVGTALAFLLVSIALGPVWEVFIYWVMAAGFVAVTGIDLATHRIPTVILKWIVIFAAPLMVLASLFASDYWPLGRSLIGGLASYGVFRVIHGVAPKGMGYGDVRLSFVMGCFLGYLGPWHVPLGFFLGFSSGSIIGIFTLLLLRTGRGTQIPFGPHLALGAFMTVLLGDTLIRWYPT